MPPATAHQSRRISSQPGNRPERNNCGPQGLASAGDERREADDALSTSSRRTTSGSLYHGSLGVLAFLRDPEVGHYADRLLTCVTHANILDRMSKMIQVRNVPDTVHRTLKARAALAGMSLSDFLLAEIRHLAERPSLEELRERLHR